MKTRSGDEIRSLYLTFPDADSALSIARKLVDERLIACVNKLPRAKSVYRWESEIVNQEEVVAFAKTVAEKVDAVVSRLEELHPYEVPCVVVLAVSGGTLPHLQWVRSQTRLSQLHLASLVPSQRARPHRLQR